ncbi:short chain dehydrogenase [Dermacoccaceae bacterium W4C1]
MKALVIGASGTIGAIVTKALAERGHEVIGASRSGTPSVDITDPESVKALLSEVGPIDAVVVASGAVPFKPLAELTRADYLAGLTQKALAQIDVAVQALPQVSEGGSITLTTGVLARSPIATGAAAAAANGALESFVVTAGAEAGRGVRINAVSPDVLASAPGFHAAFPGHRPVSDEEVATGYVLAVEGIVNGQVIAV